MLKGCTDVRVGESESVTGRSLIQNPRKAENICWMCTGLYWTHLRDQMQKTTEICRYLSIRCIQLCVHMVLFYKSHVNKPHFTSHSQAHRDVDTTSIICFLINTCLLDLKNGKEVRFHRYLCHNM